MQADLLKERRDFLKATLMATVEMHGVPDDKGNDYYELPASVGKVYGLQRQHRSSRKMDDDEVERTLREKALWDRCTRTVLEIDQDEIAACLAEGIITQEDVDRMFPETKTYAFVLVKNK